MIYLNQLRRSTKRPLDGGGSSPFSSSFLRRVFLLPNIIHTCPATSNASRLAVMSVFVTVVSSCEKLLGNIGYGQPVAALGVGLRNRLG